MCLKTITAKSKDKINKFIRKKLKLCGEVTQLFLI